MSLWMWEAAGAIALWSAMQCAAIVYVYKNPDKDPRKGLK